LEGVLQAHYDEEGLVVLLTQKRQGGNVCKGLCDLLFLEISLIAGKARMLS
jgi:hypothetical protein